MSLLLAVATENETVVWTVDQKVGRMVDQMVLKMIGKMDYYWVEMEAYSAVMLVVQSVGTTVGQKVS